MIIANEKEYAETCLVNGVTDGNTNQVLSILSKYYYSKGYKPKQITAALTTFMQDFCPEYEYKKDAYDFCIAKYSESAKKYPLYENDNIWITSNELRQIQSLKNIAREKFAFTVLCLAKLYTERTPQRDYWVLNEYKEIFDVANISGSEKKRLDIIRAVYLAGLIKPSERVDSLNIHVLFADPPSNFYHPESGDIKISDFRTLGYHYEKYVKGRDYCHCAECGILFRQNKNGTKVYCNKCAAYTPISYKFVSCQDCGKRFSVNAKNNRTCRCTECQAMRNKDMAKQRVQKARNSHMLR